MCGIDSAKPSVSLEEPALVDQLFTIFHGSATNEALPAEQRTQPASAALRSRLLSLLVKSAAAANRFPLTFVTVEECVFGAGASARLKQQGMEFAVWVFRHAEKEQLEKVRGVGCV